jgi:hypothetical protein
MASRSRAAPRSRLILGFCSRGVPRRLLATPSRFPCSPGCKMADGTIPKQGESSMVLARNLVWPLFLLNGAILMCAWGQPPSGLACVVEMRVPTYEGAVWLARISGEATVSISIGPEGAPASVDVQKVQSTNTPALVTWLKSQMSTVKFLPSCSGQTVDIRLVYRLIGGPEKAARYQPRNEVRFRAPRTFEITAPPPDYQAQP